MKKFLALIRHTRGVGGEGGKAELTGTEVMARKRR